MDSICTQDERFSEYCVIKDYRLYTQYTITYMYILRERVPLSYMYIYYIYNLLYLIYIYYYLYVYIYSICIYICVCTSNAPLSKGAGLFIKCALSSATRRYSPLKGERLQPISHGSQSSPMSWLKPEPTRTPPKGGISYKLRPSASPRLRYQFLQRKRSVTKR